MIRVEHNDSKWKFPFVSYTSEVQDSDLPLVIQLHGAGERGSGNEDLSLVDVHGFSKLFSKSDYPCVAVMPQCPEGSFWVAHVESLLEFIQQIIAEFRIDRKRVYLTGLSMGGFGTWFTAMAKPQLFAAIAPVCGGGMPWNAGVLRMPAWVFHGAQDTTVTPRNSDEMVEKMLSLDYEVKYTRVDGVGHNVWEIAYTEELLNWLLSKSL